MVPPLLPRPLSPAGVRSCRAQADAVLLGGSGAFRTDGTTQLGVRKLVSQLRGLVYHSDWLPSPALVGAAAGAATALATAPVTAAAAVASAGGATPTTAVSVANGSSGLGSGDQIGAAVCVPVWYCRRGEDDPVAMLVEYVQVRGVSDRDCREALGLEG